MSETSSRSPERGPDGTFSVPPHMMPAIRRYAATREHAFYLYDTSAIRKTCACFRALPYPDIGIHFATMANPHPSFLQLVADEHLGVFVNSVGHLALAQTCGFAGDQIVFGASAMDDSAMAAVRAAGALVNLDSLGQVARWRACCPGVSFGLRCNIGGLVSARKTHAGYFIGTESRLGLRPDEIATLSGARDVAGLHIYVGTDIADFEYFRECYRHLVSFTPLFPGLRSLDFGGGFALNDGSGRSFDFTAYGSMIASVMSDACSVIGRPLRLLLEPGRVLGGQAGYFVCRVEDVKQSPTRQFVGVNASCAQFPRPLLYPDAARHPVLLIPSTAETFPCAPVPSAVCGCSTYSRDFLARDVDLPAARIGDIVVLGESGSYCAAAHTSFLGFPPDEEIFL